MAKPSSASSFTAKPHRTRAGRKPEERKTDRTSPLSNRTARAWNGVVIATERECESERERHGKRKSKTSKLCDTRRRDGNGARPRHQQQEQHPYSQHFNRDMTTPTDALDIVRKALLSFRETSGETRSASIRGARVGITNSELVLVARWKTEVAAIRKGGAG